jgi:hypothetical protein
LIALIINVLPGRLIWNNLHVLEEANSE